jgi:alkanesulfonate monooxygenase SsuD/methylene tetrahydromethanopterin reductase-like flavin-dependent oxidoreductase (luciferase family)
MRFSFWISAQHPWDDVVALADHAAATGWEGVWIADHFMPNDDGALDQPMHECFALLAALAARVPEVRLGSLVAGNTYRHPAVLAKAATTIDHISGGRFVLGLGAGWQENEHERYGIDLGTRGERLAWFEEACTVVRSLRDEARTSHEGARYQLREAPAEPKPIGRLPLLIGASGEAKMPAVVARHADEWNHWSTPASFAHKRAIYDRALEAHGRELDSLHRSTQALVLLGPDGARQAEELRAIRPAIGGAPAQLVDEVGRWAEAGLDELIVPSFTLGGVESTIEALDVLRSEVLAAFR